MRLIVLYAVILHFVWAVCLLIDPMAANATAMFSAHVVGAFWGAIIYLGVGVLALMSICARGVARPILLLPQQAVLVVSSLTCIHAMWLGKFGDGVLRSHWFITADQSPAVIAVVLHTWAIFAITRRELRWP